MKLIAITPTYFYPGEAQAIADALTAGGLWRVHIRKPGSITISAEQGLGLGDVLDDKGLHSTTIRSSLLD